MSAKFAEGIYIIVDCDDRILCDDDGKPLVYLAT